MACDLRRWAVGFFFDVRPATFVFELGPLSDGCARREPSDVNLDDLPDWAGTLYRHVIQKRRLEFRLDYDLNIWRIGYMMADAHDHGIYLGPLNLQIEYNKFWDWPDLDMRPERLQCRCELRSLLPPERTKPH